MRVGKVKVSGVQYFQRLSLPNSGEERDASDALR
jgi:hypothetical protein